MADDTVPLVACPVCNGSGVRAGWCIDDRGRRVYGCLGGACPHEHTDEDGCGECGGTGRVAEDWTPRGRRSIRRWEAVVRALLADPAVLAAAWRAGAEAMREAAAYATRNHTGASFTIRDLPLPAYPGGAKFDDNRPIQVGDVIVDDGVIGMVAWVGTEYARVVWESEAVTLESHDQVRMARARRESR